MRILSTQDFRNLQAVTLPDICNTFNAAFSDYIVPVQLTLPLLEQKIQGENLQLDYSLGAFDGSTLAGFILHGVDNTRQPKVLYNGGTGVIPAYRGRHLIQQLYAQAVPYYRQQGIEKVLLEVIQTNQPAIKAYLNSGFEQKRLVHCYKGAVTVEQSRPDLVITANATPNWSLMAAYSDMEPCWTNAIHSVQREQAFTTSWEAFLDGQPAGFISVHLASKRIRQICVHPDLRRQGIGSTLLQHAAAQLGNPLSVINIDDNYPAMSQFLLKSGFIHTLSQYEMVWSL